MFAALGSLLTQHDPRVLAAAWAICLVTVATAFRAYTRAVSAASGRRAGLSAVVGGVMASSVWATQFLAMLAYEPRLTTSYRLVETTLMAAVTVAGVACGVYVAARGRSAGRLVGGALVGAGVAALQIINLAAMMAPAPLAWDAGRLAFALVIAVGSAAVAMGLAGKADSLRLRVLGISFMMLAILGLHFTLLAAVAMPSAALHAALAAGADDLPVALDVMGVIGLVLASAIVTPLIGRVSAHRTLQSLRSALDVAPAAIGFFDAQQRLTFWNEPHAELVKVFGLTSAVGLSFDKILAAATAVGVPYRVTPASAKAGDFDAGNPPDELELPDGRVIHAKIAPTKDGGMVAVLVDVTLTRQAERDAHEARDRAEAANRLKSDFLANMSHEIRTPLNGVLGMTHVMEAGPLDPAQRERLQVIKTSGESLLHLLNDLLDLAKVEAGHMDLEDAPFDLEATLRPACDAFAAMAGEKGVAFDLTIAPAAAGQWRGDGQRLRQVVSNLVANAVKFTAVGAIGVAAEVTETGLRVIVRDTGVGMKPEQIPHLFERFTQADSSSTREFGGTGLGLAICRDLTALMGGTLTASSMKGHGSIFTLDVPLRHEAAAPVAATPAASPAPNGQLRILAAEDNVTNQHVLAALLEPLGADLVMTADGDEAVAAYCAGDFDLVLMDIQMPNMGGVAATNAIRAWEAEHGLSRTPILAVTANLMTHQVGTYLAAGMDGVVAKPIQVDKLFDAIAGALSLQQAAQAA